jgi:hypothetical protein
VAAVIAYPATLPCVSRVEGLSLGLASGVVRSPIEAGATRQRRAHVQLPQTFTLVFVIDQALYAGWVAWMNAHAFDGWVLIALPGVLASRAGADVVPVPVRCTSDLQAELLPVHRLWFWRVRVQAEWMPSAADLVPIAQGAWIAAGSPAAPSSPDWIRAGTPGTPSNANRLIAGTPSAPSAWL